MFLNLNKYSPALTLVKLNKSSLNGSDMLKNVIGLRRFIPLSVFNYKTETMTIKYFIYIMFKYNLSGIKLVLDTYNGQKTIFARQFDQFFNFIFIPKQQAFVFDRLPLGFQLFVKFGLCRQRFPRRCENEIVVAVPIHLSDDR